MSLTLERVEKLLPGYKVIAGPYDVDSERCGNREQKEAREAVRLQKRAGCDWKLIKHGGMVYVLRTREGWKLGHEEREDLKAHKTLCSLRNGKTGRAGV